MPESTRRIAPLPLNVRDWAPFGWLPVDDTDPADGSNQLSFEWADPHVNVIAHTLDEIVSVPGALRCDEMFRHLTHTQVLMAIDHRCVVAVAPPGHQFTAGEDPDALRAFVLEPLQSIVLHKGTWHWGPYPTATATVRLFNVQGRRYAEDNERVDLAGLGLSVEVGIG